MAKDYEQYCPIAVGFAQIGDRWTLIIVRDLLFGPLRYSDLQASLPGIGTNLLAARLKQLQTAGIVSKRQLPRPAASTVYELTELGRGLLPVVLEIGKWGLQFLSQHAPEGLRWIDAFRSRISFALAHLPSTAETYELVIDGEPVAIGAGPDSLEIDEGGAVEPLARLTADACVFIELFLTGASLAELQATGQVKLEGSVEAAERALDLFRLQKSAAAPRRAPAVGVAS